MLEVLSALSMSQQLCIGICRLCRSGSIKAPGASDTIIQREGGKPVKHLARCDQGSCWVLGAGPWGHGRIRTAVGAETAVTAAAMG